MILARDLEDGREGSRVGIDSVAYSIGNLSTPNKSAFGCFSFAIFLELRSTNVLVDEHNADIFAVLGELVKSSLDGRCVRLAVDD